MISANDVQIWKNTETELINQNAVHNIIYYLRHFFSYLWTLYLGFGNKNWWILNELWDDTPDYITKYINKARSANNLIELKVVMAQQKKAT